MTVFNVNRLRIGIPCRKIFIRILIISALVPILYLPYNIYQKEISERLSTFDKFNSTVVLGFEENAIFLETTGNASMELRRLLSVEAAARHLTDLRNLQVYIFVDGDPKDAMKKPIMLALEASYKVLSFKFVTMAEVAKGTPLQGWYDSDKRLKSPYKTVHASDAYRLLLIWLNGGVYLDTDIILIKNMTFVNNTVMWESDVYMANAFLAFEKGHPFIKGLLDSFIAKYNPGSLVGNGPRLLEKHYFDCSRRNDCDVFAFPPETLLPLRYPTERRYFDDRLTKAVLKQTANSSGFHFGNSYTKDLKVFSNSTSAFATLARKNCPIVWAEVDRIGWV